ncbi:MAG: hypothetical protein GY778_00210 [bacterium]|nr:hypothetical protein [bacterium]
MRSTVDLHCDTKRAPAYLLLEVMLAMTLLVLGLATIGAQVQRSFDTAHDTHRTLRAINLVESKLAELEAELIPNIDEAIEDELEEEFGRLFPDYAWRLRIDPTQTPELWLVRLDILYQRRLDVDEEEFDFEEAEVVYSVRTLRATPATIDPARDFGADEETLERLTEAFGGLEVDVSNLSPRLLAGLPTDQLLAGLAAMQEAGLLQGVDLSAVLPPEILEMLDELSTGAGSDGVDDGSGGGR